jgi:hypothetical protein
VAMQLNSIQGSTLMKHLKWAEHLQKQTVWRTSVFDIGVCNDVCVGLEDVHNPTFQLYLAL